MASTSRCYLKANATTLLTNVSGGRSAIVRAAASVHQGGRFGYWLRDEFGPPALLPL